MEIVNVIISEARYRQLLEAEQLLNDKATDVIIVNYNYESPSPYDQGNPIYVRSTKELIDGLERELENHLNWYISYHSEYKELIKSQSGDDATPRRWLADRFRRLIRCKFNEM